MHMLPNHTAKNSLLNLVRPSACSCLALLLSGVSFQAAEAIDRFSRHAQPSIEINLEALEQLRYRTQPKQWAIPNRQLVGQPVQLGQPFQAPAPMPIIPTQPAPPPVTAQQQQRPAPAKPPQIAQKPAKPKPAPAKPMKSAKAPAVVPPAKKAWPKPPLQPIEKTPPVASKPSNTAPKPVAMKLPPSFKTPPVSAPQKPPALPDLPPPIKKTTAPVPSKTSGKSNDPEKKSWFGSLKSSIGKTIGDKGNPGKPPVAGTTPAPISAAPPIAPKKTLPPLPPIPALGQSKDSKPEKKMPSLAPPPLNAEKPAIPPLPNAKAPGKPAPASITDKPSDAPRALPSLDALFSNQPAPDKQLDFLEDKGGKKLPPLAQANKQPAELSDMLDGITPNKSSLPLPTLPKPPSLSPAINNAEPDTSDTVSRESGGAMLRIVFKETETDIPVSLEGRLYKLSKEVKAKPELRLRIEGYAGGSDQQAVTARNVSLSRVIAVRNFLMDNGIDALRIDVKAMGNQSPPGNPENYVDIFAAN